MSEGTLDRAGQIPRSERATKRDVVRGTVANLAGTGITMAVGFFTTPYFVHRLGTDAYGIYSLVLVFTMTGYFSFLDLGLQGAAVYRGAPHAARDRWIEFRRVVMSAGAMLTTVGIVGGAILVAIARPLSDAFNVPGAYHGMFVEALRIVGLVVAVQFASLALVAALQTVGRWDVVVFQRTVVTLGGVAVAALLVWQRPRLGSLVYPVVLAPLVGAAILTLASFRLIPSFRLHPGDVSLGEIRELFRYGKAMFVTQAGVATVANLDQVLIAVFLDAHALGIYAIAATIYYAVFALMPITNATVFAATSRFSALDDAERIRTMTLRGTRYASSLVLCTAAATALFGPAFIRAWVGRDFHESGVLLLIWLSHFVVTAFTGVPQNVLVALGRVGRAAWISLLSVAVNVTVSLALVGPWGMRGVIVGTVAAYAITGPFLIASTLRAVGVPVRAFLLRTAAPAYGATAAAAGVGAAIKFGLHPRSLGFVLCAILLSIGAGLAVAYGSLPRSERADLVHLRRRA